MGKIFKTMKGIVETMPGEVQTEEFEEKTTSGITKEKEIAIKAK